MHFYQLVAAADTVLVRQVPAVRTAFEHIVFVASGLTSILTLLLVLVILLMLWGMRAAAQALQAKLDDVLQELRPLTQNANAASVDVREVAALAKAMVAESRETVAMANERVRESVTELTDRVDELSAMVSKVMRAASRVAGFATTTIGGLKAGARLFGIGRKKKRSAGREFDSGERKIRDSDERPRLRPRR